MLKRLTSSCYSSGAHRLDRCLRQLQPTAVQTASKWRDPPQLTELPSSLEGIPLLPLITPPRTSKGGPGTQETSTFAIQALHSPWTKVRCFSMSPQDPRVSHIAPTAEGTPPDSNEGIERIVLYRGRGMIPFRVLVRLKIFQLAGVAALAIPINTFLVEGTVSSIQTVMASALVLGCATASITLWYFSRRYVGELSLLKSSAGRPDRLCFSVLDFWGNREDSAVELSRLVPPFKGASGVELGYLAGQTLLPIDVEGDRQYFLSIPHGRILQKDLLLKVLKGELDGEITQ